MSSLLSRPSRYVGIWDTLCAVEGFAVEKIAIIFNSRFALANFGPLTACTVSGVDVRIP